MVVVCVCVFEIIIIIILTKKIKILLTWAVLSWGFFRSDSLKAGSI